MEEEWGGGGSDGWSRGQRRAPSSSRVREVGGGGGGGDSWSRGSAVQQTAPVPGGGGPKEGGDSWARGAAPPLRPGGPALKPLKRSDTGWKKVEAKDDVERAQKATISLLNKLTAENFDKISAKMLEVDMSGGTQVMRVVIDQIFDKALSQHSFTDTYAKLCHKMSSVSEQLQSQFVEIVPVETNEDAGTASGGGGDSIVAWCWRDGASDPKGSERVGSETTLPFETEQECYDFAMKQTHLKRILLNKCQEEFEKEDLYLEQTKLEDEEDRRNVEAGKDLTSEERALRDFLRKRKKKELRTRRLGNTLFIGSLFKLEMLSERIMHQCIAELMGDHENPDVESIEALCKLL